MSWFVGDLNQLICSMIGWACLLNLASEAQGVNWSIQQLDNQKQLESGGIPNWIFSNIGATPYIVHIGK